MIFFARLLYSSQSSVIVPVMIFIPYHFCQLTNGDGNQTTWRIVGGVKYRYFPQFWRHLEKILQPCTGYRRLNLFYVITGDGF